MNKSFGFSRFDDRLEEEELAEIVLDGIDLRKKAITSVKKHPNIGLQEVTELFRESIDKFKIIIDNEENHTSNEYSNALYELSQTLVSKLEVLQEWARVEGEQWNPYPQWNESLEFLKKIPKDSHTAESLRLFGTILFEKSKEQLQLKDPLENEKLLLSSCEKLIESYWKSPTDENTIKQLEIVSEALLKNKKERKRNGKVVYRVCGDFMKQSENEKSWNKRFWILDDSTIRYFKSKKDWENGPVLGNHKISEVSLPLSEIRDVNSHGKNCPLLKSAGKMKNFNCFHFRTSSRNYCLISLPEMEQKEFDNWVDTFNLVLRTYHLKKDVKTILSRNFCFTDSTDTKITKLPSPYVNCSKKKSIMKPVSPSSSTERIDSKMDSSNSIDSQRKTKLKTIDWIDTKLNSPLVTYIPGNDENNEESTDSQNSMYDDRISSPPSLAKMDTNLPNIRRLGSDRDISQSPNANQSKENADNNVENSNKDQPNHSRNEGNRKSIESSSQDDPLPNSVSKDSDFEENPASDMLYDEFISALKEISTKKATDLLSTLLKQYSSEKRLYKLVNALCIENPKESYAKWLLFEDFQRIVSESKNSTEITSVMKKAIKQLDLAGLLCSLFEKYTADHPKEFLQKLANIKDFRLASLGFLSKASALIQQTQK